MRGWKPADEQFAAGYAPSALDHWTDVAKTWEAADVLKGLPMSSTRRRRTRPRETFVFFINGAKVRAPQGAMALIDRVQG